MNFFITSGQVCATYANSAGPTQTPQNEASNQGQYCLLTGNSIEYIVKMKTFTRKP